MLKEKKLTFLIYDKNAKPRFNELLSENLESKTFLEKDVIRTEKEESSLSLILMNLCLWTVY